MNIKQHSVNSNEASQGIAIGNLEVVYIAEKEFFLKKLLAFFSYSGTFT